MKTEEISKDRNLGEPIDFAPYQDDHEEIMRICEETGRSFEDVVRDLIDEALRLRRRVSATAQPVDDKRPADQ